MQVLQSLNAFCIAFLIRMVYRALHNESSPSWDLSIATLRGIGSGALYVARFGESRGV